MCWLRCKESNLVPTAGCSITVASKTVVVDNILKKTVVFGTQSFVFRRADYSKSEYWSVFSQTFSRVCAQCKWERNRSCEG